MSRLLSRLILAGVIVIASPVIYGLLFVILDDTRITRSEAVGLSVTTGIMIPLFAFCWIMIWRGQVDWVPRRRSMTACAFLWSAAIGVLIGICFLAAYRRAYEPAIVFGATFWAFSWLASTAIVWRETAAERIARLGLNSNEVVVCLKCGYNLTGLREARCPECGAQYTLNELVGAALERKKEFGD